VLLDQLVSHRIQLVTGEDPVALVLGRLAQTPQELPGLQVLAGVVQSQPFPEGLLPLAPTACRAGRCNLLSAP
jgi:hypothetical protein